MAFCNLFVNLNTTFSNFGRNNWFCPESFNQLFMFNWNLPLYSPMNTSSLFNINSNTIPIKLEKWKTTSENFTNYSFRFDNNSISTVTNTSYGKNFNNNKGNINNSYSNLSKSAAYQKALTDPTLENLSNGGRKWQISTASFRTDIPFAKKGTGKILDEVASNIGCNLVITSALGTGQAGNPHQRGGYKSHHNAENPKLDLKIPSGMSASTFAQKLQSTGYFSHVLNEGDHIDVQINPDKYNSFSTLA